MRQQTCRKRRQVPCVDGQGLCASAAAHRRAWPILKYHYFQRCFTYSVTRARGGGVTFKWSGVGRDGQRPPAAPRWRCVWHSAHLRTTAVAYHGTLADYLECTGDTTVIFGVGCFSAVVHPGGQHSSGLSSTVVHDSYTVRHQEHSAEDSLSFDTVTFVVQ